MILASASRRSCTDISERTFSCVVRLSDFLASWLTFARSSWGIEIVFGLAHINVN